MNIKKPQKWSNGALALHTTRKLKDEFLLQIYYSTGNNMKEIVYSTAVTFSEKELIINGLEHCIEASLQALTHAATDKFVNLVIKNLKEEDNRYQFTLKIKSLDE